MWFRVLAVSFAAGAAMVKGANVAIAVAYMQPSDKGLYPDLDGSVWFSQQDSGDPNTVPDVIVDVTGLVGVPAGKHGFHVHQYGDTESGALVGGHFTPICMDDPDMNNTDCLSDQTHGLPPSAVRNPGDMGNLLCIDQVNAPTRCVICFEGETDEGSGCSVRKSLQQDKMSLLGELGGNNGLRSIIGRSVAIHMDEDDGTPGLPGQGPGNSGSTFAYGVVGLRAPGVTPTSGSVAAESITDDTNVAAVTANPTPDTLVCYFNPNIGHGNSTVLNEGISGKAIINVDGFQNICQMRAEITGLSDGTKSFHFHRWGDLRYGAETDGTTRTALIGDIYEDDSANLDINTVSPEGGKGVFYTSCSLTRLQLAHFIGRSLTVHSGPTKEFSTIAMAVCGLSSPDTCFRTDKGDCKNLDGTVPGDDDGGGGDGDGGGSDGRAASGGGSKSDGTGVAVGVTVVVCLGAVAGLVFWRRRQMDSAARTAYDETRDESPVEWVDTDGKHRSSIPRPPTSPHPSMTLTINEIA